MIQEWWVRNRESVVHVDLFKALDLLRRLNREFDTPLELRDALNGLAWTDFYVNDPLMLELLKLFK